MRPLFPLLALLAGCAASTQTVWVKPGAGQQDFKVDGGQCRAQAIGGSPSMNSLQIAAIYSACMEGKGWERQTVQR